MLLKAQKNEQIIYGNKILPINSLEVIIMDFEKSKLNQTGKQNDLIRNIDKLFTSIINSSNIKIKINYSRDTLMSLRTSTNTNEFYDKISEIIDFMTCDD